MLELESSLAWRDNPEILANGKRHVRSCQTKITNDNFRNFFLNGKQPLTHPSD